MKTKFLTFLAFFCCLQRNYAAQIRQLPNDVDIPPALTDNIPMTIPSNIPDSIQSNIPTTFPSNLPTTLPANIPGNLPSNVGQFVSQLPSTVPNTPLGGIGNQILDTASQMGQVGNQLLDLAGQQGGLITSNLPPNQLGNWPPGTTFNENGFPQNVPQALLDFIQNGGQIGGETEGIAESVIGIPPKVAGGILDAIQSILSGFGNVGSKATDRLKDRIQGIATGIQGGVTTFGNTKGDAIRKFFNATTVAGREMFNSGVQFGSAFPKLGFQLIGAFGKK